MALNRIVAQDKENADLGYEGSHMYKKDGNYYIFTCHMGKGKKENRGLLCVGFPDGSV